MLVRQAVEKGSQALKERQDNSPSGRHYPPIYEKVIPFAMIVIAIVILVLLLTIAAILLNLIPGAA